MKTDARTLPSISFGWKMNFGFILPNSFTPDLDGINDKFCLSYNGLRIKTFQLSIFMTEIVVWYFLPAILTNMLCELGTKAWDGNHQRFWKRITNGYCIFTKCISKILKGGSTKIQGYIYLVR